LRRRKSSKIQRAYGLAARSASKFEAGVNLVDRINETLIAECNAIEHDCDLIRHFADFDPTTRTMLEGMLAVEEGHADEMLDLLEAHEGKPMLHGD
jgi:bacterioferritin